MVVNNADKFKSYDNQFLALGPKIICHPYSRQLRGYIDVLPVTSQKKNLKN